MDAGLPAVLVGAPMESLILFAQNRKGVPTAATAAKTDGPRRRETAGKPGQKTKAITDPRGWFVKPLSRIGAQGAEDRKEEQVAAVCQA
jgi:hypothetical protein